MKKIQCGVLLAALLAIGDSLYASGSYTARPPRPPRPEQAGDRMEQEKYALGKQVFNKKAKLTLQTTEDRAAQEKRLRELQARLPEKVQEKVNLPAMAGRLSARQLEALEYYVSKRYPSQ